jgi:lipopolysaccharide export LptBFGC system permease protein LptF
MDFDFLTLLTSSSSGPYERELEFAEFRRIMIWIAVIAVVMVGLALAYLRLTGDLDANLVIATVLGVFFSVVLGCGLFAAAFFSDKSGHDQSVSDATIHQDHD